LPKRDTRFAGEEVFKRNDPHKNKPQLKEWVPKEPKNVDNSKALDLALPFKEKEKKKSDLI